MRSFRRNGGSVSLELRSEFQIGRHRIGRGEPLFVIAEIGLNHGGSVERALALVDAAAASGASAVKLQTLVAADLVAPSCPAPAHVRAASLLDFFATFELSEAAHQRIAARARAHGLALIATPLSLDAVDLLERIGVDAYKIASGDLTWPQLIRRCAMTRKPLVMSTGMASLAEVDGAMATAQLAGATDFALLHCVSAYPVPAGGENLRAIATLADTFPVAVGLSDHGADESAVPLAVAMGASLYERHLVLDEDDLAVDAAVSSPPARFAALVQAARRAAAALGSGDKACSSVEEMNLMPSRRALYAVRSLHAGDVVQADDLIALRPAVGLAPSQHAAIVGRALTRDVAAGTPFLGRDIA
jgi:sialic acid synthase SpsE